MVTLGLIDGKALGLVEGLLLGEAEVDGDKF
jgi:hypothetical protein